MKLPGRAVLCVIGVFATAPAMATWSETQTPSTETFNGVSIGADGFKVLVGNAGAIVHVDGAGPPTQVASGTNEDLFDVYVIDRDFAVAVGRDVGLIWDGISWTMFLQDTMGTIFTSVWAAPEKDVVIFNIPGTQFSFHRAYYPPSDTFRPGSFVSGFDIAYCGFSGDIKSIIQNGSIVAFTNDLGPLPGTEPSFGVLFDNTATPLSLTAAWFPVGACLPDATLPFDAFAIDSSRLFYRFDPLTGWGQMPVDGGSIPLDHTLTWIGGTGPDNVIAVGFKPAALSGNEGVVWIWDGQTWSQELSLPLGTPGFADIDVSYRFERNVFSDGFELLAPLKATPRPGDEVDATVAAEEGKELSNDQLAPTRRADITVSKTLLTELPITPPQRVTFRIALSNDGPDEVTVRLIDFFRINGNTSLTHVSNTCGAVANSLGARQAEFTLAVGDLAECDFEFDLAANATCLVNTAAAYVQDGTEVDQLRRRTFLAFIGADEASGVMIGLTPGGCAPAEP